MSKELILETAYRMADRDGFNTLTRDAVAIEAGVAAGLVNHYYSTMDNLRDAVITLAIESENLAIIAQALSRGNPAAMNNTSKKLKLAALATLAR